MVRLGPFSPLSAAARHEAKELAVACGVVILDLLIIEAT